MAKPIRFNEFEEPLCPNDCGVMYMQNLVPFCVDYKPTPSHGACARCAVLPQNHWKISYISEARAFCIECKHTMIVADERIVQESPGMFVTPNAVSRPAPGYFASAESK